MKIKDYIKFNKKKETNTNTNISPKIKVAVIGIGHLGKHHARIYSELNETELVCVVDTNEKVAKKISKKLKVPYELDYKKIKDQVDAVSIVVPTISHYEISKFFLENNKHVLVEKPVTETVKQAETLERIVNNNNVVLQVGHIERFNPVWLAVQEKITNPRFIETHRLSPFKNRSTDVGVVLDLMIHDIDIILNIVNKKIIDIRSSGVGVLGKHEDIVNSRLEFECGCVANINASRISNKSLRKIRIFQHNSYLTLDYMNQSGELYELKNSKIKSKKIKTYKDEPLKIELSDFIKCVKESSEPKVSIIHGKLALSAALKIIKQIN